MKTEQEWYWLRFQGLIYGKRDTDSDEIYGLDYNKIGRIIHPLTGQRLRTKLHLSLQRDFLDDDEKKRWHWNKRWNIPKINVVLSVPLAHQYLCK